MGRCLLKVIIEVIKASEEEKKDIVENIYYLLKDNDSLKLDTEVITNDSDIH